MRIEANLSKAEGYVTVRDAGVYEAAVESAEVAMSKSSNEPKVTFDCRLIDGPNAGGMVGVILSLQPKALWKFREFRDACGVADTGDFVETDDFVGRHVKLAIGQPKDLTDEKTGKVSQRTQIDAFMPV